MRGAAEAPGTQSLPGRKRGVTMLRGNQMENPAGAADENAGVR
jgi:hypothetical protein